MPKLLDEMPQVIKDKITHIQPAFGVWWLADLSRALWGESPVWLTTKYDAEMADRTCEYLDVDLCDFGNTKAGRNRLLNLIDWVKASETFNNVVMTVGLYRVNVGAVGEVDHYGRLLPAEHLRDVATAFVELLDPSDD